MRTKIVRRVRVASALIAASIALGVVASPVAADGGLEVTTPFPAVAIAPGSDVSFDLTVSSTRTADVSLSLAGVPDGWTASLLGGGNVVDAVAVTPDTDGELRLDVEVPADTTATTGTIRLTAQGGGAQDVLTLTVRVDAAAAGDIALTTSTPALTGSTDTDFSFTLSFSNDTAQDVTLAVQAAGPDARWDVEATLTGETQAASTIVEAGADQGVTVAVTAPEDVAAGQYPIKVTATAGDRTVEQDLTIDITGSYSLTLTTPDGRLSTSGAAGGATQQTFTVTNTGTAPLTEVELTATPPTGWEVTFEPANLLTLSPNDPQEVVATITPSDQAVAGDYVVTVSAGGAETTEDASAQIRFTVETSPLFALIGLALIVLILGGLYYVFRTYGRR